MSSVPELHQRFLAEGGGVSLCVKHSLQERILCFQAPQHCGSHFSQVILVWSHRSQGWDIFSISP